MNLNLDASFRAALDQMIVAHNLAIEGLTREQLAAVLVQAFRSGDFQRCVGPSDAQCVTYIPWREVDRWRTAYHELLNGVAALAYEGALREGVDYPIALLKLVEKLKR